jgi:hypothetical protein
MKQYECFELNRDINPVVIKGMQGVILEVLDPDTYIVEFVKEDGRNYEYGGDYIFTIKESDIKALDE